MESSVSRQTRPHLRIRPQSGWQSVNLGELWQFRDLLVTLAERDVRLRYRQTALGVIWVILQPLVAAAIFAFVFGRVAKLPSDGIAYFPFSYAGLLGWNAFNSTLTKANVSLIQNAQMISKVYFPRLVLPLSTVYSTAIDFLVALVVMFLLMPIYHIHPGPGILLLPVWFALIVALAVGIGLYTAAVTVRFRDVQYVLPVFLQFLLYASPVAYSVSSVPAHSRAIYFLNPLSGLLEAFRWSLLGKGEFSWSYISYSVVMTVVLFALGAFSFRKMERTFADVI